MNLQKSIFAGGTFAKQTAIGLGIATAAIAFTSAIANAQSIQTIDCRNDMNRAERTICASQQLQILDAKITEVYADVMNDRRVSPLTKNDLRRSQFAFLSRRDACGGDYLCLEDVMNMRLGRIRNYY